MLNERRARQDLREERGSIVVAVSVLMLLMLIGTALVTRGQTELRAVATEGDVLAARAGAEQGVAEVLALLDSGERGDFSDGGRFADGEYRYSATALSETSYLVEAEGEINGEVRAVEVTLGTEASAPYALFVDRAASINDNGGTISGRVATNGSLSVSGTALGDVVDLHGPSARCNNCPTTNVLPDRLSVPFPEVPTGKTRDCPSNGSFGGVLDGQGGVPYLCDTGNVSGSRVQFSGTVSVINPPLIVFVRAGLDIRIRNASINGSGAAEDFQVLAEGDDYYWWFDAWNSKINGVLYGPGRDSLLQASSITGQVSIGVLWISDPYDAWIAPSVTASGSGASGWTVTSWERAPSS